MVHNSLASVLGKLVVFGAARPPSLARWSPASWYDGCVLFLKSFALFMPILTQINAPFGRFALSKSIFNMPGNVTFMLMEAFGPIVFLLAFASAPLSSSPSPSLLESLPLSPSLEHLKTIPTANCVLASLYVIHYINRAFLQPLRGPPRSPSHLSVFLSAAIFQSANGFVMGTWLGGSSPPLQLPKEIVDPSSALSKVVSSLAKRTITRPGLVDDGMQTLLSPFFLLGIAGWLVGLAGNIYHDEILFDIRRKAQREKKNSDKSRNGPEDSKPKYDVPHGGLYSLISYPNYLCECELHFFLLSFSLDERIMLNCDIVHH